MTRIRLLRIVIGSIDSRQFFNHWEAKPKPSHHIRAIFPAFWASYSQLLGFLIGSSRCLLQLWLVGVITSVSCFRQSFVNHSFLRALSVLTCTWHDCSHFGAQACPPGNKRGSFLFIWVIVCQVESLEAVPSFLISMLLFRPVAGGEAGGARAPPEIFRFELNSATKVEFCLLTWTTVNGSYSFQVLSIIVRLYTVVLLNNLELCKGTKSYFCSAKNEKP